MKMTDLLYVSFVKDESGLDDTGLCVGRVNADGSHTILKMELDSQAEIIYRILTEQMTKAALIETERESENEIYSDI